MLLVFLLGILLGDALGAGTTCCLDGWLPYKHSCYLFGHDAVHFVEAEHYCQTHGAHLVHVNDASENAFLRDRMRERKDAAWWLGMTDEMVEGQWQWLDTNTDVTFFDWASGQPDSIAYDVEDCARFDPHTDFQWADLQCTASFHPLCEMSEQECEPLEIVG